MWPENSQVNHVGLEWLREEEEPLARKLRDLFYNDETVTLMARSLIESRDGKDFVDAMVKDGLGDLTFAVEKY